MSTSSVLSFTIIALSVCFLSGCGSGQDRSAKTAKSSAMVASDAPKAKQDLDQVVRALKNVRDASDSADLKKLYAELAKPTEALNHSVAAVIASSDDTVAAGKAQNDEWHKQADTFTDADLRNASTKRQGDLRNAIDDLALNNASLKTRSDGFVAKLNQTLKALDLDLSQPGVNSLKPTVGRLIEDEGSLRDALSTVVAKNKVVRDVITP